MAANLESLLYPSQIHSERIQEYYKFFLSLFGNELVSFGYERLNNNGAYELISNLPRVTEIWIDVKAYQEMRITKQPFSVEHGFIYANEFPEQSVYHQFRIQLDKQLGIYTTFYAIEPCLHYRHVFVWNFRAPLKSVALSEWESKILLYFIDNKKSVDYVLSQFKKTYSQNMRRKEFLVKLLETVDTESMSRQAITAPEKHLIESQRLKKEDLYLKNLDLSQKEATCIYFYLQGMNSNEIGEKMFVSRRTVEDYIKRIKQKLLVNSRSEIYAAMEKLSLWRDIL